jgi:low density lipoprotein-related protein 2
MGVAVHKGDVYWVDRNLASVFKASKLAGNTSLPSSVRTNLPRLRDIAIFDVANQPMDEHNPCLRLGNGGCDQLCFSFPLESATIEKTLFRCACATGELSDNLNGGDGRKCDTVTEFLVFSTRTEIRAISLDPQSTNLPFKPVVSVQISAVLFFFSLNFEILYVYKLYIVDEFSTQPLHFLLYGNLPFIYLITLQNLHTKVKEN